MKKEAVKKRKFVRRVRVLLDANGLSFDLLDILLDKKKILHKTI